MTSAISMKRTTNHITFDPKAVPPWLFITGSGALMGKLIWGTKGAIILGIGAPVAFGVLLWKAMKDFQ
jgi:hypothetical protein